MARKTAAEQGDTPQQIVDSAFALFGRYGYDGVSIDQIAKKTGLSKGAMYWHFKNKDELFIACLRHLHTIFRRCIFTPFAAETDPKQQVSVFFAGLDQMLHESAVLKGIGGFWLEPGRANKAVIQAVWQEFETETNTLVANAFKRGHQQGVFRIDQEPLILARALMVVMEAVVLPLRRHTEHENRDTLAMLQQTFFLAYG